MPTPTIPIEEMSARYRQLYTPAVADALDDRGLWHQIVDRRIQPLVMGMRVAGPAFTMLGRPERSTDRAIRQGVKAVDAVRPHTVVVMDCCGEEVTGHWGELLTNGTLVRGGTGAVIDGGVRDTAAILALGFPVFCKYRSPADAKGRWNVVDFDCPVTLGGVPVRPGDFIVGDADGVVVVPAALAVEVLLDAEQVVADENEIRGRVRAGESVAGLYMQYKRF
ncbi:MAG: RraA family protein [Armatimonadota bacterium]|nr:RraA family protein [Armatimonadota bacterium]MDR7422100.1 RraA family protein [Armatimonadota bacterium]MDR7453417.1 RraA family protein [Armatimonadota bacterium]MDR7456262.1 RraA family protein [Armatimonadota bacterium]MDR7495671.1 RraA family protein [Armatimonadota bacterium]